MESLKSFVLKHFYVYLNTFSHWRILLAAGAFSPCTRHTLYLTVSNNRITLNKPSYTLCFLLWRHYFYWENTHHVESSHRITNLSPRNVDYTIIKLLRLIFTKTGMCSVTLKNEVDLLICRYSFVNTLYKVKENAKHKLSTAWN